MSGCRRVWLLRRVWGAKIIGSNPITLTIFKENMDRKIYNKFSNKKFNAAKEGIPFELSFDDYVKLLNEAGITYLDVGNKGYHLARYNDMGPYSIGNCRFIFYKENMKEKKYSEKAKLANIENARKMSEGNLKNKESWVEKVRAGVRKKEKHGGQNKLTDEQVLKKVEHVKDRDFSVWGSITKTANELGMSRTNLQRLLKRYKNSAVPG